MAPPAKGTNGSTLVKYRVDQLEKWQPEVEKHLEETDGNVGKIDKRVVKVEADVTQAQATALTISKQQASTNNWLRGIFGSLVVGLLLLIFDLIKHTH